MKHPLLQLFSVCFVIVVIVFVIALGLGSHFQAQAATTSSSNNIVPINPNFPTVDIKIVQGHDGAEFSPTTRTVAVGTLIHWSNQTKTSQTVVLDRAPQKSITLAPHNTSSPEMFCRSAGSFGLHLSSNPNAHLTVTATGDTIPAAKIELQGNTLVFNPEPLNIKIGDLMMWRNNTDQTVVVVSDDQSQHITVQGGEDVFMLAKKTGTSHWHLQANDSSHITVVVQG